MRIVHRSFEGRFSDDPRALHEALVACGELHSTSGCARKADPLEHLV